MTSPAGLEAYSKASVPMLVVFIKHRHRARSLRCRQRSTCCGGRKRNELIAAQGELGKPFFPCPLEDSDSGSKSRSLSLSLGFSLTLRLRAQVQMSESILLIPASSARESRSQLSTAPRLSKPSKIHDGCQTQPATGGPTELRRPWTEQTHTLTQTHISELGAKLQTLDKSLFTIYMSMAHSRSVTELSK